MYGENFLTACEPCYAYTLPACPDVSSGEDSGNQSGGEGGPEGIIIKAGLTPETEYDWYLEDKFGKVWHDVAETDEDGTLVIAWSYFPAGYFTQFSGPFVIYIKENDEAAEVVPLSLGNSYLTGEYQCIKLDFADIESDNTTIE